MPSLKDKIEAEANKVEMKEEVKVVKKVSKKKK